MEGSLMTEAQSKIRISVRNLVEFVLRSGDLDNRRSQGGKKEAMQAGSRLHRKIQKRMGADYRSEVALKHQVREDEFSILLEGRADGIITETSGIVIDEIKCIYMDVERLEEPDPVHLAQALCYGYMYASEQDLDSVGIQLTYCNIETEQIRRFRQAKTREELEEWFQGLIHEYVKWARYLYHHSIRRTECLKELQFPYAYREGQKELAVSVYRSIARGRNLYIQAPTGIGKTLSCVFPSLKAIGEGYGEKLFYLTAKTITRSVAEETFELLRERENLYFSTVTITAKEKLCVLEKPDCNPVACPRAKGYFDRVNDAVYEIIQEEQGITRETILAYAEKYQVCPFELCLDISSWVDGIIDVIAELYRTSIISAKGQFVREGKRVAHDEHGMGRYILATKDESETGREISITEVDIDSFIRAKAAIFSAINIMLSSLDMDVTVLEHVYVAGGIGSGINMENAVRIGMFPDVDRSLFEYIGNSSLAGAYAMARSDNAVDKVDELASNMTYMELSTNPRYMDEFVAACFLPHTNRELFPSSVQE